MVKVKFPDDTVSDFPISSIRLVRAATTEVRPFPLRLDGRQMHADAYWAGHMAITHSVRRCDFIGVVNQSLAGGGACHRLVTSCEFHTRGACVRLVARYNAGTPMAQRQRRGLSQTKRQQSADRACCTIEYTRTFGAR